MVHVLNDMNDITFKCGDNDYTSREFAYLIKHLQHGLRG